ncbi:MAG: paraquat-inducible protein A [Rudaea sp.]|nr:paraquat-inducible protein A [Rudaea sp.]
MTGIVRARDLHLVACTACGLLCRGAHDRAAHGCPRCGARLHVRKPDSIGRTWALLIASVILYVPANVLPVMHTGALFAGRETHTILGGIVELWNTGSWDLALIVFVASVVVPILKMIGLSLLALSARQKTPWRPRQCATLYRMIEAVGHWSMLDVFVVALLVALVDFGNLAEVLPGPGIVAFGAVVVLTMLASASFDPRLIWDAQERHG